MFFSVSLTHRKWFFLTVLRRTAAFRSFDHLPKSVSISLMAQEKSEPKQKTPKIKSYKKATFYSRGCWPFVLGRSFDPDIRGHGNGSRRVMSLRVFESNYGNFASFTGTSRGVCVRGPLLRCYPVIILSSAWLDALVANFFKLSAIMSGKCQCIWIMVKSELWHGLFMVPSLFCCTLDSLDCHVFVWK